ncbi:MAG: hypothetical protein IJL02_10060 [Methanobrevibacter sp.]|uniref:hypothetical protein n=1 Tax=Methanobrevibacter sp. TaxID=66852 RepID=UPI0025E34A94|nr:hypothetical protein [Methanobrevibacter sp.]MBQ6100186.1 hypothetical protein [Methanobrevibacter sp.]
MIKREYILILILIIIILIFGFQIINETSPKDNNLTNNTIVRQIIANSSDEPGTVEVIKNIGNPNGKKIAYVVGVHPLEHQTHETLVKILPGITNLNNSYDIYIINVTQDVGHYGDGSSDNSQGRQNGQNLALKYVYPAILNGSYDLAIDVHSNVGAYEYQTFVFSPVKEGLAGEIAMKVADECENISYYAPSSTTSGPYLTIPLNEKGIPAFYFEEYSFAPQNVKDSHMIELINAVDNV